ncbi:MAG: hypothetical protein R3B82_13525 [Sandaracinaceae bacterium]
MLRRGRAFVFVGAAGLVLAVLGQLEALGPVASAGITVASTVMLALIAHGGVPLATEAVAFGASGAVAYEATRSYVPLVASGLLLTFVFGTRAMRSRTWRELAFHLGLAFASGVAASWVARANAGLEVTLWMTAIMVAAPSRPRRGWFRATPRGPSRCAASPVAPAGRAAGDCCERWSRTASCAISKPRPAPPPRRARLRRRHPPNRAAPRREGAAGQRTIDQLVRVARAAKACEELLGQLDESSERLAADGEASRPRSPPRPSSVEPAG